MQLIKDTFSANNLKKLVFKRVKILKMKLIFVVVTTTKN